MKRYTYALLFAAIMISTFSCISDDKWMDNPGETGESTDVILHLKTPGGFSPSRTRGLTYAHENTIDNVYVLVFDKGDKLVDIKVGEVTENNTMTAPEGGYSGSGAFKVTLPPSNGDATYKLVVLANAEGTLGTLTFINPTSHEYTDKNKGDGYTDVIATINAGFTAKYGAESIPMWGETGHIAIEPSNKNQTVELTRALARIDVGVGADPEDTETDGTPWVWDGMSGGEEIPFRLSSVHVFRVNNSYGLIPDATVLAAGNPTLPTGTSKHDYDTPQKVDMFSFTVSNSLYTTQDIYVPENDVKMGGTLHDTNHTNRMAIVVGGSYDANGDGDFDEAVSYYRLDFAKNGALMNVLRNHLYQFNIPSVSGKGYDDPVVAYEATGISMEYNVFDWNANDIGSGFAGPYSFSVSPNELTFVAAPTGGQTINMQTINVTTDHPDGWTAEVWDNANGTGTGARSWLTVPASGTGTIMNISASTNTASIRTAWIHITSGGRVTLKVKITQKYIPGFRAPKGVIGYYAEDPDGNGPKKAGDLTLEGDKWLHDNLGYGNGTSETPVYITYFKFGSLIAISSGSAGSFTSDDIVQAPSVTDGYMGLAALKNHVSGFTAGINSWGQIPGVTTDHGLDKDDEINEVADASQGLGDPCDYYFGDGDGNSSNVGSTWRLPTARENYGFVGGYSDWEIMTISNNTFSQDWDKDQSHAGTVADPHTGSFPIDEQGDIKYLPVHSNILPAAGGRDRYNGSVNESGKQGCYWSSTVASDVSGYYLFFDSAGGRPSNTYTYSSGYAVRCVQ